MDDDTRRPRATTQAVHTDEMGKKGGGKKRKGGKTKGAKAVVSMFEMPDMAEIFGLMPQQRVEFVNLSLRFASLAHLDFEWHACPTLVSIGTIKESIRSRHNGGVATILLYRHRVHESCLINGPGVPDSTTLKDMGVEGVRLGGGGEGEEEGHPQLVLFYNYPAEEFEDPLLMAGFTECKPRFLPMDDDVVEAAAAATSTAAAAAAGVTVTTRKSSFVLASPSSKQRLAVGGGGLKETTAAGGVGGTAAAVAGGAKQLCRGEELSSASGPGMSGADSSQAPALGVAGAGADPTSSGLIRGTGF